MADAAGATNELADVSNERPDLVALGQERLSWLERRLIAFVRWTFEPGFVDRLVRRLQRIIGSTWIHHFTKHLRFVFGMERLPRFEKHQSYVLVSNHRSFFDLYVVTGHLVRLGLKHRILFPVRASFFYDSPLGLFVNGVMSFFAMYPPIFRERKKAFLNPASIEELGWLLRRGGMLAGIHPEGTRNLGDDPYSFLPAQRGVGKIIHAARRARDSRLRERPHQRSAAADRQQLRRHRTQDRRRVRRPRRFSASSSSRRARPRCTRPSPTERSKPSPRSDAKSASAAQRSKPCASDDNLLTCRVQQEGVLRTQRFAGGGLELRGQ